MFLQLLQKEDGELFKNPNPNGLCGKISQFLIHNTLYWSLLVQSHYSHSCKGRTRAYITLCGVSAHRLPVGFLQVFWRAPPPKNMQPVCLIIIIIIIHIHSASYFKKSK